MGTQSNTYSSTRRGTIWFSTFGTSIGFAPYLETFSFEMETIVQEEKTSFGDEFRTQGVKKYVYSISFNVPSESWAEAKENHRKFSVLIRMNLPDISDVVTTSDIESGVVVRFSNLIHDLSPTTSSIPKDGIFFKISNISYKPDIDLGFFDNGGMMYAKNFTISLELIKEGGIEDHIKLDSEDIDASRKKGSRFGVNKYNPGRMFGFKTPFGEK